MSESTPPAHPMKVREFAEFWGLTPTSVYKLIKTGELPAWRLGKSIRVDRDAFVRVPGGDVR